MVNNISRDKIDDLINLYNKIATKDTIMLTDEFILKHQNNIGDCRFETFNSNSELFNYLYNQNQMIITRKTNSKIKKSKYELIQKPYNKILDIQDFILLKGRKFIIEGSRVVVSKKYLENTKNTNSECKELYDYFTLLEKIKFKK